MVPGCSGSGEKRIGLPGASVWDGAAVCPLLLSTADVPAGLVFLQYIASRLEFVREGGVYSRLFGRREVMIAYLTTGETEGFRESRRRAMCMLAREALREADKISANPSVGTSGNMTSASVSGTIKQGIN